MKLASIVLVVCASACGQGFEAASVKPNRSPGGQISIKRDAVHFNAENTPLRFLITFAYDIRDTQLTGGPAWMQSDRWDIVAKMENPVPNTPEGAETLRAALRALLADRFHLKTHRETKEMTVSVLTVGKGGAKLQPAAPESKTQMRGGMGSLEATRVDMPMLARSLSSFLGRTVVDGTGIKGEYDIKLLFAPEAGGAMAQLAGPEHAEAAANETNRPALGDALQEQLGLKLETRKENVELLVVDAVDKAAEN